MTFTKAMIILGLAVLAFNLFAWGMYRRVVAEAKQRAEESDIGQ